MYFYLGPYRPGKGKLIYRGRYLVTMNGPPIPWGCVRIIGDKVTHVGPLEEVRQTPDEQFQEYPDSVLMPGLINAHCHLELGSVRGCLPRGENFSMWVSRLKKALMGMQPEQYRLAARLGVLDCLKNGTTTVIDVGNTGEAITELATLPIRSFPYLELIGLDPNLAAERLQKGVERFAQLPAASDRFQPTLTCHAPYSCSVDLMHLVTGTQQERRPPYTLHVAESVEEMNFFQEGRGPLWDFCQRIYPGLSKREPISPIQFLHRHGLIPQGSLFAHCNFTDAEDLRILTATETSVVHCPRSKSFLNHPGFKPVLLRDAGINLCLGTDSLASNDGLSLFDEMAELHRNFPEIPCREILAMATLNGARALGRTGDLGCIKPGASADLIAISLRHHPDYDLYEEIVSEAHEVILVLVDGEEIIS